MKFSFSNEQEQFRTMLRRFLAEKSPTSEIRRLMATDQGWERETWKQLNSDLGLSAVHIPEAYGGQGFGFVELAIVLEEMGRALLCGPYFSSVVLAANAILNAGSEDQKQALLPGVAAGETVATLAFTEENGRWDSSGVTVTAKTQGDGYRLDGVKSFVLDGHTADLVVVLARKPGTSGDEGLSFFTVRGDAKGLERRLLKSVDATRKLALLKFDGVQAELLGEAGA
ncbi:MAG: acyl-CoA dehydrogenase family protein, partial [Alphaproteobacteria bacterium]